MLRRKKEKDRRKSAFPPADRVLAGESLPATMPGRSAADPEGVRHGLAAFGEGDYRAAIHTWSKLLRNSPGLAPALAEAHFRLALASGRNLQRSVAELSQATQLAPNRAAYHYHLGLVLSRLDEGKKALAAYGRAVELDPGNQRFRRQLALALLADENAERAAALLEAESQPSSESDLRLLALARLQQDGPAAALAVLDRIRQPTGCARLARAVVLAAGGQDEPARLLLESVLTEAGELTSAARQQAWLALGSVRQGLGDLNGAAEALRQAHALGLRDAELARACRQLATSLTLDECLDKAVALLDLALEVQPDEAPLRRSVAHGHEVLGNEAVRREDFARAAEHWDRALKLGPGDDRLARNLALAYERLRCWADANACWEELVRKWKKGLQSGRSDQAPAAESRRRLAVAHRHIGENHQAAGDLDQAIRAFERALNFDPSDLELRKRTADLCLENEDWSRAIDYLKPVLAAHPDDLGLLSSLGMAYGSKGDERQAIALFEQVLAREPGDVVARRLLASICHRRANRLADSGQLDRAIAEMERALSLNPGDGSSYLCLGSFHLKAGKPAAARRVFGEWLAMKGGHPMVHLQIAEAYLRRGITLEARRHFQQAEQLTGRHPRILAEIAIACLEAHDYDRARPYLPAALELDDARLLANVARALYTSDSSRAAEAIPYLERAAQLDPKEPDPHMGLAAIAIALGDHARAARELDQAEALARTIGAQDVLRTVSLAKEQIQMLGKIKGFPASSRGPR